MSSNRVAVILVSAVIVVAAVVACTEEDGTKSAENVNAADAGADVPAAGEGGAPGGTGGMAGLAGGGGLPSGGARATQTGGGAGVGAVGAVGGSGGVAGSGGAGGSATGGSGGLSPACSLDDACCPGAMCTDGYKCLGATCSCIEMVHGNHYLRTDGTVVHTQGDVVVEEGTSGMPLTGVTQIYQGQWHACALRNDNTVWCWAISSQGNNNGQLGDGNTTSSSALHQATQVMTDGGGVPVPLTNVVALNSGASTCYIAHTTCAVRGDGSLYCWGASQGGGGSFDFFNDGGPISNRPLAVPIFADATNLLDGVEAVSLGGRHACALRSGGEVWCWGGNIGGPLGQGDEAHRTYPVQVALPGPALQLGAGSDLTCARVSDGVYCWGANSSGQVGIGEPAANSDGCINFCVLSPTRVIDGSGAPLANVIDLNVAYLAVCAVKSDYSLHCWGAGAGSSGSNVAVPQEVQGGPVTNVAQHTSCSSGGIDEALRYLSRDNRLMSPVMEVTQQCN